MNIPKCSTCRRWKKEYWCIDCKYKAKDLVDVVRCKDCINNTRNVDGVAEDWCLHFGYDIEEDDFCSYGEREEE